MNLKWSQRWLGEFQMWFSEPKFTLSSSGLERRWRRKRFRNLVIGFPPWEKLFILSSYWSECPEAVGMKLNKFLENWLASDVWRIVLLRASSSCSLYVWPWPPEQNHSSLIELRATSNPLTSTSNAFFFFEFITSHNSSNLIWICMEDLNCQNKNDKERQTWIH